MKSFVISFLAFSIIFINCSPDTSINNIISNPLDTTPTKVNHAPQIPIIVYPQTGNSQTDTTVTLVWSSYDIDGDRLLFDIYFDEGINPRVYSENVTFKSLTIKGLDFNKKYYWKICAKDSSQTTCTQVNYFITKIDSTIFKLPIYGLWKDTVKFYSSLYGDTCFAYDYLYLSKDQWYENIIQYRISKYTGQIVHNSREELKNQGTKWYASSDSLFLTTTQSYWSDSDTSYTKPNNFQRKMRYQKVGMELWLWGWRLGVFGNNDIVRAKI